MEVWKSVEGYKGVYEVSDRGRVKSLARVTPDGRSIKERLLRPAKQASGHLRVVLYREGVREKYLVHRLVAVAFIAGNTDLNVLHKDGDPGNNNASNLRWGTQAENTRDAITHGTYVNANSFKTHCPQNHEYTTENTYINPRGSRECRKCIRSRQDRFWSKQKAEL